MKDAELTDEEEEIIRYLVTGMSRRQIHHSMGLRAGEFDALLTGIYRKTNTSSLIGLTEWATSR